MADDQHATVARRQPLLGRAPVMIEHMLISANGNATAASMFSAFHLERLNDRPICRDIARRDMHEMIPELQMDCRQSVKRNRGIQVMLGMVGHVPHKQSNGKGAQRCPRIGQTIPVFAACCMLDDQQCTEEWLGQNQWQKPIVENSRKTEGDCSCSRQIDQQLHRYRQRYSVSCAPGNKRQMTSAAEG